MFGSVSFLLPLSFSQCRRRPQSGRAIESKFWVQLKCHSYDSAYTWWLNRHRMFSLLVDISWVERCPRWWIIGRVKWMTSHFWFGRLPLVSIWHATEVPTSGFNLNWRICFKVTRQPTSMHFNWNENYRKKNSRLLNNSASIGQTFFKNKFYWFARLHACANWLVSV